MPLKNPDTIVAKLRDLQRQIRTAVFSSHAAGSNNLVARDSEADTIYAIDATVDPILESFCEAWGKESPLVLVAEGLLDEAGVEVASRVFPHNANESDAPIRLIVDPIDGTRGIMYDKRPAWSLAGVAPNKGAATRLQDIEVAVMTELPTSRMGYGDVLFAVRGRGATCVREPLYPNLPPKSFALKPSTAATINHGFATVSNFFPGTKVLASELMEHLAANLIGAADVRKATVFDDQYIATAGQFYELIVGHDRFNADLRPVFYALQNQPPGLCCHPYDCATLLIAEEAGVVITDENGNPLNAPLDTTSPVSWIGYANPTLRNAIEPLVQSFFQGRK